jgi:hypothetical protein
MRFTSFVSLAVLSGIAAGSVKSAEVYIFAYNCLAAPSTPASRDCSAEVARYNMERREARGLTKRTFYTNMLNVRQTMGKQCREK